MCARTSLHLLRNPTMNAHPRVVMEEVVTTNVAKTSLVVEVVAEPASSTTRMRSQVLAGVRTSLKEEKLPGEGRIRISPRASKNNF